MIHKLISEISNQIWFHLDENKLLYVCGQRSALGSIFQNPGIGIEFRKIWDRNRDLNRIRKIPGLWVIFKGQWRHESYGPKTTLTYTTSEHIILLQKMINYCGWKLGKPIEILFYLLLNNFLKKNISFRTIFFDYEILTPFLSVTILLRIFLHRYNIGDRLIYNY